MVEEEGVLQRLKDVAGSGVKNSDRPGNVRMISSELYKSHMRLMIVSVGEMPLSQYRIWVSD